jgi:hypothetical protein
VVSGLDLERSRCVRDSDESVALNFLREDSALGVDERGRSEWLDAADNGRFGVNRIGRDGLGVDVGAMLVVVVVSIQNSISNRRESIM